VGGAGSAEMMHRKIPSGGIGVSERGKGGLSTASLREQSKKTDSP